jgi:predicted HD phosphohydrolase
MATVQRRDQRWPALSLNEIERLLTLGAERPVEISDAAGARVGELAHSQLDHALQTAALLQAWIPDDEALQVAGLVHDLGQMMDGVGDIDHAAAGAAAVRAELGDRVADLVALHVEAKRYLVAKEGTYAGALAADSVASLARQGGAMSTQEMASFERDPLLTDAVLLRRADESGKVEGLQMAGLGQWMKIMRRVHTHTA